MGIVSPVKVDALAELLQPHPDRELVEFLLNGFREGFDVLFTGQVVSTEPNNLRSAAMQSEVVTQAIETELSRGHTSGPFPVPPFYITHCSHWEQ